MKFSSLMALDNYSVLFVNEIEQQRVPIHPKNISWREKRQIYVGQCNRRKRHAWLDTVSICDLVHHAFHVCLPCLADVVVTKERNSLVLIEYVDVLCLIIYASLHLFSSSIDCLLSKAFQTTVEQIAKLDQSVVERKALSHVSRTCRSVRQLCSINHLQKISSIDASI